MASLHLLITFDISCTLKSGTNLFIPRIVIKFMRVQSELHPNGPLRLIVNKEKHFLYNHDLGTLIFIYMSMKSAGRYVCYAQHM